MPAVHPRDWNRISSLVDAVPPAFWKLVQNRSVAAAAVVRFLGSLGVNFVTHYCRHQEKTGDAMCKDV